MQLIYIDESGNTGRNLSDKEQPLFVLAALIVPEDCWICLEQDLECAIVERFPGFVGHEIHASELRRGTGAFKHAPLNTRLALRDDWLTIAAKHGLTVVYRSIEKRRYAAWQSVALVPGIEIHPHVSAFALLARVVDDYLRQRNLLGMFISDENKEIVGDVEKSIKFLRGTSGTLKLHNIIEKGFFIDSKKSRVLQLCDVCALSLRKKEERSLGMPAKSCDDGGIELIEPLIHRGSSSIADVLKWLEDGASDAQK